MTAETAGMAGATSAEYERVAAVEEIPPGGVLAVSAGGRTIALFIVTTRGAREKVEPRPAAGCQMSVEGGCAGREVAGRPRHGAHRGRLASVSCQLSASLFAADRLLLSPDRRPPSPLAL